MALFPEKFRTEAEEWFDVAENRGVKLGVRFFERAFGELIVVDRRAVFSLSRDTREWNLLRTEEPVLELLCFLFETLWELSEPIADMKTLEASEVKLYILRMMARGDKDEVIARCLGISVRTCRRRIAEVLDDIGAVSRFQAGLLVARQYGDVLVSSGISQSSDRPPEPS